MLPPGLCALFTIAVMIIQSNWRDVGCEEALLGVALALSYHLTVPAVSIYLAAKELFFGQDKERDQTTAKALKMFEHLGQYFLFRIL